MKKLINQPSDFVKDVCEGIECAYGDRLRFADPEKRVLLRARPAPAGRGGIVTAGGSGHLPVFLGDVGQGMLDGCTVGNVFASPSAQKMEQTIRACDFGAGVLCLYGNYGGDRMNFELACESVEFDGICTRQVRVTDDISSSPAEEAGKRRGVAGVCFRWRPWPRRRKKRLPIRAAWAWRSRRAFFPRWELPRFQLRMMKWKSAWASTASRVFKPAKCLPQRKPRMRFWIKWTASFAFTAGTRRP